ncbi:hypothetical protein M0Q97_13215, partial [Candidatus Dojkabacteria bacterium]|nr:hypothetical protein [Candidatus Dojkabacteria bacterium]
MKHENDFQTLDELLASMENEQEKPKYVRKKKTEADHLNDLEKPKIPEKPKDKFDLKTTSGALLASSQSKLKHYLNTSPQYKNLQSQIDILKDELLKYHKLGAEDMVEKTKALIIELTTKKQELNKIFKNKRNPEEIKKIIESTRKDPKMIQLKEELKIFEKEYFLNNANSLMKIFTELRQVIDLSGNYQDEIIDIDDIYDEDFDNIVESKNTQKEFQELTNHIAKVIDTTPEDILEMTNNQILQLLKKSLPNSEELKLKVDAKKMEISSYNKKLKGSDDITDVIFEIFDFNVDEEQPKEMLAAANIKYVTSIAYNMCSNMNMNHMLDDAISYGLLGLSTAIDKWYKLQKLSNSALTLETYIYQFVSKSISRGLYQLNGSGRISPSVNATIVHKRKRFMKLWLENNPEFKDMPEEMLENLIPTFDGSLILPETTVTESQLTDVISGGDSRADVWSNAIGVDTPNLGEVKLEYEQTLIGLKNLFKMFETKVNKETGIKQITNKKIFDIYDYIIFRIALGLDKTPIDTSNQAYMLKKI